MVVHTYFRYHNNCNCKDHCSDVACFAADVDATFLYGFDSMKLDGCGAEENVELWYDLFAWTAKQRNHNAIVIENCHNGPNVPTRVPEWCPFHFYRASTDIAPVFGSILANINAAPALAAANLSFPGCWACE